jgi:hypothetical protein
LIKDSDSESEDDEEGDLEEPSFIDAAELTPPELGEKSKLTG